MMTEQTQNKEQAILEAAEREFLAKGFDGARTISIARAAGVTHAMLHYYFRTKENIFERILDEKMRLMGELVMTTFGRPGLPLLERLRDGIARHFDFIVVNPDCRALSSMRFLPGRNATKSCGSVSGKSWTTC